MDPVNSRSPLSSTSSHLAANAVDPIATVTNRMATMTLGSQNNYVTLHPNCNYLAAFNRDVQIEIFRYLSPDDQKKLLRLCIEGEFCPGSTVHLNHPEFILLDAIRTSSNEEEILRILNEIPKITNKTFQVLNGASHTTSSCCLSAAVKRNFPQVVKELIQKNSNPKAQRKVLCTETPLVVACKMGHDQIVRILLENTVNSDVYTPPNILSLALTVAVETGKISCARLILEKHPEMIKLVPDFLLKACENNDADNVAFALSIGAANHTTPERSPLHKACTHNASKVVNLLLDNGFDPNTTDFSGKTALEVSLQHGHRKITKSLLRKGANVLLLPMSFFHDNSNLKFFTDVIDYSKAVESCNTTTKSIEYIENAYKLIALGRHKYKDNEKCKIENEFCLFGDSHQQKEAFSKLSRCRTEIIFKIWNMIGENKSHTDDTFFKTLDSLSILLTFCKFEEKTFDTLIDYGLINMIFLQDNSFFMFLDKQRWQWADNRQYHRDNTKQDECAKKCVTLLRDIIGNVRTLINYYGHQGHAHNFSNNMSKLKDIENAIDSLSTSYH